MSETISIGFTGSRDGMTRAQIRAVYAYMLQVGLVYGNNARITGIDGHHGDCIGSDHEFHVLTTAFGWRTVAHPPVNASRRAWCMASEIREPKDYLARDWDIVQDTGELLAAPKSPAWERGSGTWTTIGYAVNLSRPATVFLPDGSTRAGSEFFGALRPGRAS